jgi:hypothetical protein
MSRMTRVLATVVAGFLVRRYLANRSGVAERQTQPFVGGPSSEVPPVPGGYGGMPIDQAD